MHDLRLVALELALVVLRVADDDHAVTRVHEPCSRSVDDDVAGLTTHHIGFEPGAVVDVEHVNLLVFEHVGECHQLWVERDRARVVEVGAGHGGPMDLRLHHRAEHQVVLPWVRMPRSAVTTSSAIVRTTLSMSRAGPTRAPTARSTSPSRCSMRSRSDARRTSAYPSRTSGSQVTASTTRSRSALATRSPALTASAARRRARYSTRAAWRSSGDR